MTKYKAKEVMRAQVSCAGTQADQPPGAGRLQEESPAEASIPLGHWSQIQVQVHGAQGPDTGTSARVTGPRYRYRYMGHRVQIRKQLVTWSGNSARWSQVSVVSLDSDTKELRPVEIGAADYRDMH
jgi:hypothetical protein